MPIINNFDGNETEITKIVNVVNGVEYDITDVYLADKHIFTVWGETEGALPRTFNANGDNAVEWQVHGETGGVGQRTENSYNSAETDFSQNQVLDDNGNPTSSAISKYTKNFTSVKPSTEYYFSGTISGQALWRIYYYDAQKNWISRTATIPLGTRTFTVPSNCAYIRLQVAQATENTDDWQIIKGSTAPTSYIPYGYEVPMAVESGNLFDYTAKNPDKGWVDGVSLKPDGTLRNSSDCQVSEYIMAEPNTIYILDYDARLNSPSICFYDANKVYISGIAYAYRNPITVLSPLNAKYVRLTYTTSKQTITKLYTSETISLYIGSTPLDSGEYTSYKDQKIYKYVSGVLTPTDPPVPIPALPTLDGVTVVDTELDSSAVHPEKAYIKYRKENT